MKKNKIISFLLVLAILVSTLTSGFLTQVSALSTQLKVLENFENYEAGASVSDRVVWTAGGAGSAVASESFSANGTKSAKLWAEEVCYSSKNILQFGAGDFTGSKGIIAYVKMPYTADGSYNSVLIAFNKGTSGGYVLKENSVINLMAAGSDEWTAYGAGQYVYFPSGFEGYIRIDFSSLRKNWGEVDDTFANSASEIDNIELYIGELGGKKGDEDNAFYIDYIACYDEYFDGAFSASVRRELPQSITLVNDFEGYASSDTLGSAFAYACDGSGTATAARTKYSMAAKLTAESQMLNSNSKLLFPTASLSGKQGIIMYVKMPVLDGAQNSMMIALNCGDNGGYILKENTTVKVLRANSFAWEDNVSSGTYLLLESGFEGYIKLDFDNFRYNWGSCSESISESAADITDMQFWIYAMGGVEADAMYIDDIMLYDSAYNNTFDILQKGFQTSISESGITMGVDFEEYSESESVASEFRWALSGDSTVTASTEHKGARGSVGAKLYTPSELSQPVAELFLPKGFLNTDTEGIMMYLKLPYMEGWGAFSVMFKLCTTDGGGGAYINANGAVVEYLNLGSTAWQTTTVGDIWTSLPNGFEGYVKFDWEDLTYNWGSTLTSDIRDNFSKMEYLSITPAATSDSENALYIDDIMTFDSSYIDSIYNVAVMYPIVENPTTVLGDINGDGEVNIKDLVRLKKYFAGIACEIAINNADADSDGFVSVVDLVTIRKQILAN